MNDFMKRYIIEKRRGGGDYRGSDYGRGYDGNSDYGRSEFEGEFRGDYESDYARSGGRYNGGRGRRDYAGEEYDMPDGRRGVKYTGPYGIGGRRHYPRRDRASYDGNDYGEEDELKLTKKEMRDWKENLENADGTDGAHFDLPQIEQAAQAMGVQFRGYDIKELCLTANALYSDYCKVLEQFIPREKEAMFYVKMAKAFLDDPDAAVKGSEKLAAYYYAIVCDDEE